MIQAIVEVLKSVLLSINNVTHNYGLSIIILTILIRIITWPLMSKQLSSAKAMQEIQPEIKKLQEKYKHDQEKLNAATMELWKKHKINPVAGCLPLLLQIPILWAMFRMLQTPPNIEASQFFLLTVDMREALMSTVDGVTVWNSHPGYWILVALSGLTTFLQQKLTITDQSQRSMMIVMPLMLLYFSLRFPAGVLLYWVVNNLLSLGQHLLIHRGSARGEVEKQ